MKARELALVVLAVCFVARTSNGQEKSSVPLITASGTAEIRVVPDVADLYFQVQDRHRDLAQAYKLQAERAAKVLAALRAAGIKEAELQASQVQIMPRYEDDGNSARSTEVGAVRYYAVSQDIACTLNDIKKVPDVTAAAVSAGVTFVGHASLRTSALRKHRDQARANAIKAAREKAVALAAELGAKVGKPYTISEGGYDIGCAGANRNVFQPVTEASAGNSTFAPGMMSVTATISVSFRLE